jgi:hypothetical protein
MKQEAGLLAKVPLKKLNALRGRGAKLPAQAGTIPYQKNKSAATPPGLLIAQSRCKLKVICHAHSA